MALYFNGRIETRTTRIKMQRKSSNLFGFEKAKTARKPVARSSATITEATRAAYRAGQKSGDTGLFGDWLNRSGLIARSDGLRQRLEQQYRRGVEDEEYHKPPYGEKTERTATRKHTSAKRASIEKGRETSAIIFRGVKITKRPDGNFSTSIDPDTWHDSLKDAKEFIVSYQKGRGNPRSLSQIKQQIAKTVEQINRNGATRANTERLRKLKEQRDRIEDQATENPKEKTLTFRTNPKTGAFERCVEEVSAKGGAYSPRGVCAAAGRKKYGAKKFQAMAQAGKTRALKQSGNPSLIASLKQDRATATVYRTRPIGPGKYKVQIAGPRGTAEETFSKFEPAMAYARLALHELSGTAKNALFTDGEIQRMLPGSGVGSVLLKKFSANPRAKNPIGSAQKTYEEFHGLPSQEVLEYVTQEHYHSVTAGVGKLVNLEIVTVDGRKVNLTAPGFRLHKGATKGKDWWEFDPKTPLSKVVQTTTSEDGRQLFFVGGDQKIDLKGIGLTNDDSERDHVFVGTITELTYRTRKTFENKGEEEVDFYHAFGKEGSKGVCPLLMYKPRNPSMIVYGGRYRIAAPAHELEGVSPGIIG